MNRLLLISLIVLLFTSCKRSDREKMIGKWHAVQVENIYMDSFFAKSKAMIDTIGVGHDAATNMQLYGIANMDSMRQVLRAQYDSARAIQQASVTNTYFEFRKDSTMVTNFGGGKIDSSKWYFDDRGVLVVEKFDVYGPPSDKISMQLLNVSDTAMKLKFIENGDTVTVTFHPEGK